MTYEQYRRAAHVIRVAAGERRRRLREAERLLSTAEKWTEPLEMMEMQKMVEELEAAATELDELADIIEEEAERRLNKK